MIEWFDEAIGFLFRREDLRATVPPPAEALEGAEAVLGGSRIDFGDDLSEDDGDTRGRVLAEDEEA